MTDLSFDAPLIGPELRADGRYWYSEQRGPIAPRSLDLAMLDPGPTSPRINPSGSGIRNKAISGLWKVVSFRDGRVRDEYTIENVVLDNCGDIIELANGSRIRKLIVNGLRATNVRPGSALIRLLGMGSGGVEAHISDFSAVYSSAPTTLKGEIPTAIQAGFKTSDASRKIDLVRIERAYVEGAKQDVDGFTNGDAYTAEPECALFELIDCEAVRCSDAGIDSKAAMTRITRYRSERTRYGIKLWGPAEGRVATIVQCWSAAVLLAPLAQYGECSFTFVGLISEAPDKPLFEIQNRAVRINATGRYDGKQLVRLVDGGRLLPGSTWNGEAIA